MLIEYDNGPSVIVDLVVPDVENVRIAVSSMGYARRTERKGHQWHT